MLNYIRNLFNKKENQISALSIGYQPIIGKYIQCDPINADLTEPQRIYEDKSNLHFTIPNFDLAKTRLNNPSDYDSSQRINCAMTLHRSIDAFNKACLSQFGSLVPSWNSSINLKVFTKPGVAWNACYERGFLKFFYNTDQTTKNIYYACDSAQVVAHECGHGLLDSLRPEFWNVQNAEAWSFHEAFGDIQNLMTTSQSKEVVLSAFNETNGNLSKSNCMTRIAGQFGSALNSTRNPPYLRDISMRFNYASPNTLPGNSIDAQLSSECHNFSRIFSGAWYSCVVQVYNSIKTTEMDTAAFEEAKNVCYRYLIKAIKTVPNTVKLFEALANMMLFADQENSSKYQKILSSVFLDRNIISPNIKMLSNKNINDVKNDLKKSNKTFMTVKKTDNYTYAHVQNHKKIKLSDHIVVALSTQPDHPIYDADLIVANESIFIYNKNNILIHESDVDEQETIDEALRCVNTILNENMLDQFWFIEENQLKRIKADCGFNVCSH